MNRIIAHNLKKSLPTILKVILGIIALLYVWIVFFGTQSTEVNTLNFISYGEWFGGNKEMGEQIIKSLNILIPVGFLVTAVLYATRWKEQSKFIFVTGISIVLSVAQFVFITGTFDLLKLINNVIGGCIGYALYCLLQKLLDKFRKKWKGTLPRRRVLSGWLCILIGLLCLLNGADVKNNEVEMEKSAETAYSQEYIEKPETSPITNMDVHSISIEKSDNSLLMDDLKKWDFVFQLDSVDEIDNELVLKGFTFVLRQDFEYYKKFKPEILLRTDEASDWFVLDTEYGQERQDVNQYFLCEYDYSKSGFTATVSASEIDMKEEYEVLIRFGGLGVSTTNTYITGENIHYASENTFIAPETEFTDLEDIVKDGTLRLYKPDKFCWVYQYEGDLYWILEDGFLFGIKEYTHIPYELHTTQVNNIPSNTKTLDYDNPDILFERDEITNEINCGFYRVMKKELPQDYSISCIRTGLWLHSESLWVWKSCFWPVYEFKI